MSRLVDLSPTVAHGLVTYPGMPGPVIGDHLTRAERVAALGEAAFRLFAVPVKVRGMGTFPVRAFARIP